MPQLKLRNSVSSFLLKYLSARIFSACIFVCITWISLVVFIYTTQGKCWVELYDLYV